MKLHLLLLASLFNLSSGFMATLKGPLNNETACTGNEYADFKQCVTADESMANFTESEDEAFIHSGGDGRKLSCMGCPTSGAPIGHWCFVMCGSQRRRLLEEVPDSKPNFLRRVLQDDSETTAVFADGEYTGNEDAIELAKGIISCFGGLLPNHPCLGDTVEMELTVTL
jgi:hypothetical protein